jgi:hypothetical protein
LKTTLKQQIFTIDQSLLRIDMGACLEKQNEDEDIEDEEPRRRVSQAPPPTGPLSIGTNTSSEDEQLSLDNSYTHQRLQEDDYFQHIVSQTARNLIEISSNNEPFFREEQLQRQAFYKNQTKQLSVNKDGLSVFSPPVVSPSNSLALLAQPSLITGSVVDQLKTHGRQIGSAYWERMVVQDKGRIIVQFDDPLD